MVLRGPQRMDHSGRRMHVSSSLPTTPSAQKDPGCRPGGRGAGGWGGKSARHSHLRKNTCAPCAPWRGTEVPSAGDWETAAYMCCLPRSLAREGWGGGGTGAGAPHPTLPYVLSAPHLLIRGSRTPQCAGGHDPGHQLHGEATDRSCVSVRASVPACRHMRWQLMADDLTKAASAVVTGYER
jgi:hypothetical protein